MVVAPTLPLLGAALYLGAVAAVSLRVGYLHDRNTWPPNDALLIVTTVIGVVALAAALMLSTLSILTLGVAP